MTTIFIDPDEYESLEFLGGIACPELEAITGADFCISKMPINPASNPKWHIENGTMFINIKRGYDLLINHAQRLKFAARMQALNVTRGRALYLGIGIYREDKGCLAVSGYKAMESVAYSTYLQIQLDAINRGMQWMTIPSQDFLPTFIEATEKTMNSESKITVLGKTNYQWEADEWWQQVEEPASDDIRKVLSCGLPEFGPKKAQALYQYLTDNHLPLNLFNALVVLSAVKEKGKRGFDVPMFGIKSHRQLRQILFNLADDEHSLVNNIPNLSLDGGDFQQGARAALDQFHLLFQEKLKAGVEFKKAYEEAINVVKNTIGELIPF